MSTKTVKLLYEHWVNEYRYFNLRVPANWTEQEILAAANEHTDFIRDHLELEQGDGLEKPTISSAMIDELELEDVADIELNLHNR